MGFLRKLFSGGGSDKEQEQAREALIAPKGHEQPGQSNDAALAQTGLDQDEEKGSFLSRAWQGMKDTGSAMKAGAKGGAVTGAGAGFVGGAAMSMGILALPGAILGGLAGAVGGAAKGLYDHIDSDDQELVDQTKDIPGYHVILEQFAHIYAYGKGDMATLGLWGYEMSATHEDARSGLRVIALSPKSKDAKDPDGNPLKPVVAFRGTCNMGGALDDLNAEGVGTFQFSSNEKEIRGVVSQAKGPSAPDVTGHSLGGALAQLAAARLGGMVGNIVTFQAAGINEEDKAKIDADEHKATHYRTEGDLVHSGGETFATGEVIQFEAKGTDSALSHVTQPLAQLNALRGKTDSDVPKVQGIRNSANEEWVKGDDAGHHEGRWAEDKGSEESLLHKVERSNDVDNSEQSALVSTIGRKNGLKFMNLLAKTGVADRQSSFAGAWKAIREVCLTVNSEKDIPPTREKVVDLCIEHEVPPQDHGRFISQAEAAMIDALEGKVAMIHKGTAPGMA